MFGLFNKKKEKKKNEALNFQREIFNHIILRITEKLAEDRSLFVDIYDVYYEKYLNDETIPAFGRKLPELEDHYQKALKDLVNISDNNTLFFTTREEMQAIDILEQKNKISEDMIKTLPYLAEFTEKYNNIFEFYAKLDDISSYNNFVWAGLNYSDADCSGDTWLAEHCNKCRETCLESAKQAYITYVIHHCWKFVQENYPQYSTEADHDLLMQLALDNTDAFSVWKNAWYQNFKNIDAKDTLFGPCWKHLYTFFEDTTKEFGSPTWLDHPIESIGFGFESSFPLFKPKDYTKEELTRIYNLYLDGTLSGKYRKENDPKYSEDIQ